MTASPSLLSTRQSRGRHRRPRRRVRRNRIPLMRFRKCLKDAAQPPVRVVGRTAAHRVVAAIWRRAIWTRQKPAFAVVVTIPLVFVGAVGAGARPSPAALRAARVTAVSVVAAVRSDPLGPKVIAIQHAVTGFHIAEPSSFSPPPAAVVVNSRGTLGIPTIALSAYRNAERIMSISDPACGVSWNLLAGIGRIESGHARDGATDAHGAATQPIYGPALDGTVPGNEVIVQNVASGHVSYVRAIGPMQFLPDTWARYASDGDGDGMADPQNLYDSALAAAKYLCSGGLDLREPTQVMTAILRYNNSIPYARNVLGWAGAYATGVIPVDLPPIIGPPPPISDVHYEHPEGLGPGLPMNITDAAAEDPLAGMPQIDLSASVLKPWPISSSPQPPCSEPCTGAQRSASQQQPPT